MIGVAHSCINRQNSPAICKKMAIDLNMCEPNGSDLAGHGSHEIVLKLNAPINSQTVGNKELVETFFDLDGATCSVLNLIMNKWVRDCHVCVLCLTLRLVTSLCSFERTQYWRRGWDLWRRKLGA